ncbi:glycosyltransferase family 1 protein [bacterium]|nr:MAG: glycosyltransferase family 1 protein [bacterium]
MRVGIDAQLAVGTATGIGEYVRELVAALRARGESVSSLSDARLDPWRFDRRVRWDQLALPLAARRAGVELLHCASGTMPALAGVPMVVTVHDVVWLREQRHARPYARWYFGAFSVARYRRARLILVDSEFSGHELVELGGIDPQRVRVVYPGVSAAFAAVERRPSEPSFALAVGTVEPRKNLEVAIRALREVPQLRLVSVGPPTPYVERCLQIARDCGVAERVELRGYVTREALLDLYARAAVALMPSRYEGFGLGAAQALVAGVPLLAARSSSLVEVAPDQARLPVDEPSAWAQALRELLAARESRERESAELRARACERFSWGSAAERVAACYGEALSRAGR